MAEKTKLQLQIEASARKIQEEQRRLKQLEKQQTERDRKDRNHRLCKRHGFIESLLPDIINLTDEQFQAFAKQHIASKPGIAALADFMTKNTPSKPVYAEEQTPQTDTLPTASASTGTGNNTQSKTTAPTGTKPQSNTTPAPNGTGQNNGNQQTRNKSQNAANPANRQGETA